MRQAERRTPSGAFVAVVGPSGAGKDTLLAAAQAALACEPGVVFVRRVVTRPAVPSLEDHDSLSAEDFLAAREAGRFCITWQAHGLHYGLPGEVAGAYDNGATIVSNVSRAAIGPIAERFPALHVVEVTAPRDVLRARLLSRGRESAGEVERRLERSAEAAMPDRIAAMHRIDNSGRVEDAARSLIEAIRSL
jgi:ribose 1,5-bisphosphokinase